MTLRRNLSIHNERKQIRTMFIELHSPTVYIPETTFIASKTSNVDFLSLLKWVMSSDTPKEQDWLPEEHLKEGYT